MKILRSTVQTILQILVQKKTRKNRRTNAAQTIVRAVLWAALAAAFSCPANAASAPQYDTVRHKTPTLPAEPVVIIEGEGSIILVSWKERYAAATLLTERDGFVFGFSNYKKRPAYNVEIMRAGDTLVVKPQRRPDLWTIGLALTDEKISQTFYLPAASKVFVKSEKGTIRAQGMFAGLEAYCKDGTIETQIVESGLRLLLANSPAITVNRSPLDRQRYKMESSGAALYILESPRGSVEVTSIR